ncbi:hypothetical protein D3C80_1609000 [compost metagenome]
MLRQIVQDDHLLVNRALTHQPAAGRERLTAYRGLIKGIAGRELQPVVLQHVHGAIASADSCSQPRDEDARCCLQMYGALKAQCHFRDLCVNPGLILGLQAQNALLGSLVMQVNPQAVKGLGQLPEFITAGGHSRGI